jgi:hypothetical protein
MLNNVEAEEENEPLAFYCERSIPFAVHFQLLPLETLTITRIG